MKVFGLDENAKPFIETVHALNISPGGIHLAGLKAINRVGEIIGIQYNGVKVRATVVWVGVAHTTLSGHIGLHFFGDDPAIWQAVQPLLQASAPEEVDSVSGQTHVSEERRVAERYPCHGGVNVRVDGMTYPIWASVTDLSSTGCYLEAAAPVPLTTKLEMVFDVEGHVIRANGEVRGSFPGVGMGVVFTAMSDSDRQQLDALLKNLAARQTTPISC
jgi:hypothetical protein